jgi:methyl-accepting chemotaxis protein
MNFGDLKIPHKLLAVFAVMLTTIVVMGVTLFINQREYEGSVARTERAYESLRAADTAAFRLTRQENSLRGFLLSGDDYYVKRLEEAHKPKFLAALEDLRKLSDGDQADLARVAEVDAAYANYRTQAIEPGETLGRDPATRPQAVELVKHDGVADKAVEPVENAIEAITKDSEAVLATEAAAQKKASLETTLALVIGIGVTIAMAVAGGLLLTSGIAGPVAAMTAAMRRLASGDNGVVIPPPAARTRSARWPPPSRPSSRPRSRRSASRAPPPTSAPPPRPNAPPWPTRRPPSSAPTPSPSGRSTKRWTAWPAAT